MNKLMQFLSQKRCIVLLILLFLINSAFLFIPSFPLSSARITENAPDERIPDMRVIYSVDDIYNFLEKIGERGRQLYRFMHLTSDLAFPFIYGLLFFGILSRFVLILKLPRLRYAPLLPWVATFFDLAENLTLNYITSRFPEKLPVLTWTAQFFSLGKFTFLLASILAITFLGLRIIFLKRQK